MVANSLLDSIKVGVFEDMLCGLNNICNGLRQILETYMW